MDSLTRRTFLEKLSTRTAGGFIASGVQNAFATARPEPHISFPSGPRDRMAITSYAFRAYIESPTNSDRNRSLPGMDLAEFASEVATRFNVHNIEPHDHHFRSLDPIYLASLREALRKARVNVVDIAVGGEGSFYDADLSTRKKAIAFTKKWVDVAVEVDSPSIRAHNRRTSNSPPNVQRTADSREVTEYGGDQFGER